MKRIAILTAALAMAGTMASVGQSIVDVDRERPVSAKRRRVAPVTRFTGNRSKYMPHQGAKERERAKRCYMVHHHGSQSFPCPPYFNPRSAPCMMQMSEREFELREDSRNIGRP